MLRHAAPALAAALIAGVAFAPSAASAATAVTSPADGAAVAGGGAVPATFAVSGTATGESAVELRCGLRYSGSWQWSQPLEGGESIPVLDGGWSASAVVVPANEAPCRLLAFGAGDGQPSGSTDPAPAHTGPRLRFVVASPFELGSGPDPTQVVDADMTFGGLEAVTYASSIGWSGLQTELIGPEPSVDQPRVFDDANGVRTFAVDSPARSGPGTRLGLQVDGVNAYVGGSWLDAGGDQTPFNAYLGIPAVSATTSVAADGSLVVAEHDTVRSCTATEPSQYPLAGFTCMDSLVDPGVAIDVTTTVTPSGTRARRDWVLRSTDGAAHAVRLALRHAVQPGGPQQREWRLPDGSWSTHAAADEVASPGTPFSLAFRDVGAPEPDPENGLGAITFGVAPTALRFSSALVLDAVYALDVPASGSTTLPFVLSSDGSLAALDADVTAAETALGAGGSGPGGDDPGAGGGGPAAGSGGNPAAGGRDGSVPPGGESRTPARGRARAVAAPRVSWRGRPALRRGRLSLGATVACPGSGPACTATVVLRTKPKSKPKPKRGARRGRAKPRILARGTVRVPAGRSVALTVKVKLGRAALKRARPTVSVAARRGALRARTASRTLKLR